METTTPVLIEWEKIDRDHYIGTLDGWLAYHARLMDDRATWVVTDSDRNDVGMAHSLPAAKTLADDHQARTAN
jgi:hypothetical protein